MTTRTTTHRITAMPHIRTRTIRQLGTIVRTVIVIRHMTRALETRTPPTRISRHPTPLVPDQFPTATPPQMERHRRPPRNHQILRVRHRLLTSRHRTLTSRTHTGSLETREIRHHRVRHPLRVDLTTRRRLPAHRADRIVLRRIHVPDVHPRNRPHRNLGVPQLHRIRRHHIRGPQTHRPRLEPRPAPQHPLPLRLGPPILRTRRHAHHPPHPVIPADQRTRLRDPVNPPGPRRTPLLRPGKPHPPAPLLVLAGLSTVRVCSLRGRRRRVLFSHH